MQSNGKRNLIILGIGAVLIASATTGMSLWLYWKSGDIYLDRSRPGYLPDEDEAQEDSDSVSGSYTFSDSGALTAKDLDEYLRELKKVDTRIKALKDPYAAGPLSDESLGITNTEEKPAEK